MTYEVRRIDARDWQQFRMLQLEALRESPSAFSTTHDDVAALSDEDWKALAKAAGDAGESTVFVALDESGCWVGMASVGPLVEVPGHAHIHGVYVAPAHRGPTSGLASRLMEEAICWARDHTDATHLTLGVREDNPRALAFYRRFGLTDTGKMIPSAVDPSKKVLILGYRPFR